MNATFGGYNPAQYINRDQTLSRIGDRFANVVSNAPALWREGEKWQDERNARDANEQVKQHTFEQFQKLNQALGEDAIHLRPPQQGEPSEAYVKYVGDTIETTLANRPQLYDAIMKVAPSLARNNDTYANARVDSALMGAQEQIGGLGGTPIDGLGQQQGETLDRFSAGMQATQTPEQAAAQQMSGYAPMEAQPPTHDLNMRRDPPMPQGLREMPILDERGASDILGGGATVTGDPFAARRGLQPANPNPLFEHHQKEVDRLNGEIETANNELATLRRNGVVSGSRYEQILNRREKYIDKRNAETEKMYRQIAEPQAKVVDPLDEELKRARLAKLRQAPKGRESEDDPRSKDSNFDSQDNMLRAQRAKLIADLDDLYLSDDTREKIKSEISRLTTKMLHLESEKALRGIGMQKKDAYYWNQKMEPYISYNKDDPARMLTRSGHFNFANQTVLELFKRITDSLPTADSEEIAYRMRATLKAMQ